MNCTELTDIEDRISEGYEKLEGMIERLRCTRYDDALLDTCELIYNDRNSMEDEIYDLEQELEALKLQVAKLMGE